MIYKFFFQLHQYQSQYQRHIERERQRIAAFRANETEEQRGARQLRDLLWHQHDRGQTGQDDAARGRGGGRGRGRRGANAGMNISRAAWNYDVADFNIHNHTMFDIGSMSVKCTHCSALRFKKEPDGICCKNGKVSDVPLIPDPPEELMPLFDINTQRGRQFLANSRKYNMAFCMTSIASNTFVNEPGYMPTVKIQGQMSHQLGPLLPSDGDDPKFLQIYFIGNTMMSWNNF